MLQRISILYVGEDVPCGRISPAPQASEGGGCAVGLRCHVGDRSRAGRVHGARVFFATVGEEQHELILFCGGRKGCKSSG